MTFLHRAVRLTDRSGMVGSDAIFPTVVRSAPVLYVQHIR